MRNFRQPIIWAALMVGLLLAEHVVRPLFWPQATYWGSFTIRVVSMCVCCGIAELVLYLFSSRSKNHPSSEPRQPGEAVGNVPD